MKDNGNIERKRTKYVSTPSSAHAHIYDRIAHLARSIHGTAKKAPLEPQDVLTEVTEAATTFLDRVDHAAVTLVRRSAPGRQPQHLESTASTGEASKEFDRLQHEFGQGPCFEAIWTQSTVYIPDHTTEDRWPKLSAAVLERTPIRSSLSIQLYVDDLELGALNLHSNLTDGFDRSTEDMALNLAAHAAIALSGARRGEQFHSGLASRDIIGQAKGIIMERFDIDAVEAFRLLSKLSQESNVQVSTLAIQLVRREHPTRTGNAP
ncbi:GAF and ANTAR domain-containing protein [Rhodococcus sp. (in: high G+C Gram-positive bacteria)]|uniref:GAF and ANTAR domain-containing protein n=1 Tax=Rhodococcus sp. TaxID=1831 RepID=UPI0032615FFB